MCGVVVGVPTKVPTVFQRKRGLFGGPERKPFWHNLTSQRPLDLQSRALVKPFDSALFR
jgi:hypothetical protein